MKKRFLFFFVLAAVTAAECRQSQSNNAEESHTKSGPGAIRAAASRSAEAATQQVTVKLQATLLRKRPAPTM